MKYNIIYNLNFIKLLIFLNNQNIVYKYKLKNN